MSAATPHGLPRGASALVTGGGGGLGTAMARMLIQEGLRPVLMGRDIGRLERAAKALASDAAQTGIEPVLSVPADVSDRAAVEAALGHVHAQAGAPLVLVHAAGMASSAPLLPPDDALWERTLRVNANGSWIASTACLPGMLAEGAGFIALVASTAAVRGYRYTAAYVASKHAVLGLGRALDEELHAKGVRVHTLCPGFLDTPMTAATVEGIVAATDRSPEEARASIAAMNASGRLIAPEEVAEATRERLRAPDRHGEVVVLE